MIRSIFTWCLRVEQVYTSHWSIIAMTTFASNFARAATDPFLVHELGCRFAALRPTACSR